MYKIEISITFAFTLSNFLNMESHLFNTKKILNCNVDYCYKVITIQQYLELLYEIGFVGIHFVAM